MSNLTDFFPSGGGGLTPKFEEFNASGTFTPTQALIDAGGYIEVFLVAGGGKSSNQYYGGCGGEVLIEQMYLTILQNVTITIGSGTGVGGSGGNSEFAASGAGGIDLIAYGGSSNRTQNNIASSSWGGYGDNSYAAAAGNGVLGYGAGGGTNAFTFAGVYGGKNNSGQGASSGGSITSGSGYCLIKWYE